METVRILLSDVIIQHPEVDSFQELLSAVRRITSHDLLFLEFDVRPDYRDTPRDWQWQLEGAFVGGSR